jgi:hypothetical protein
MENCTPSGSIITARRSRRHKEVPQWTVRDDYCIWWIGEQRAVRYDHVQRLSAHESDQQTLIPGRLSATRTTQIIHRWQKANLVIYIKVHAKSPGWIYLTLHGLRFAQLDYRYSTPRESTLTHLYYIIQVPLQMEEEYDEYEMEWQSERYLREEQKRLREDRSEEHI